MSTLLTQIFVQRRHVLVASMMRIVRDVQIAEDLAQEAFIRTQRALDAGPIEHIEAFLHKTARNLAIDHHRQLAARSLVESRFLSDAEKQNIACAEPSAETVVTDRQRLAKLKTALSGLPPRAQRVLVLSRLENWSNVRIADHLGISERTVFNDLRLALGHCRDALKHLNDD